MHKLLSKLESAADLHEAVCFETVECNLVPFVVRHHESHTHASTVPAPAGSYVIHRAKGIHYDGAKDEPAVIQVWGMGPATITPAEKK